MAYQTSATTSGGRNGRAILQGGGLALAMAIPKEMGGSGDGHNPEQLFALGYSSCFGSALLALSKKHNVDAQSAKVTVAVTMDKDDVSFGFNIEIRVQIPGADRAAAEALVADAHTICPYSRATHGNVPVTLTVV